MTLIRTTLSRQDQNPTAERLVAPRKEFACTAATPSGATKWFDNIATLTAARTTARQLIKDGAASVVIGMRVPRPAGHEFGARWVEVEKHSA